MCSPCVHTGGEVLSAFTAGAAFLTSLIPSSPYSTNAPPRGSLKKTVALRYSAVQQEDVCHIKSKHTHIYRASRKKKASWLYQKKRQVGFGPQKKASGELGTKTNAFRLLGINGSSHANPKSSDSPRHFFFRKGYFAFATYFFFFSVLRSFQTGKFAFLLYFLLLHPQLSTFTVFQTALKKANLPSF